MRPIRTYASTLALLLAVSACSRHPDAFRNLRTTSVTSPVDSAVKTAIENALATHVEAAKAGDAKAASVLFSDDATLVEFGSYEIRGRRAIDSLEDAEFRNKRDKGLRLLEAKYTVVALSIAGDVAYTLLSCEASIQETGKPVDKSTDSFMAAWRRQADGGWRMHYYLYYPVAP